MAPPEPVQQEFPLETDDARRDRANGCFLAGETAEPPGGSGVDELLRHPDLWRADRLDARPETITTGHDHLDSQLAGGWPRAGLAEFLLATAGIGELRLLLPLIRQLSREQVRWVAWVAPPFVPYAPALQAAGVDVRKMLLIHPRDHRETLWALERASRSGNCSLVLAWPDERQLSTADTRRLQVAAQRGHTLTALFRPEAAASVPSMAELRMRLAADANAAGIVHVDILKRRGGWPVPGLEVRLENEVQPEHVHRQLSLWREYRRRHRPQHDAAAAQRYEVPRHAARLPSATAAPPPSGHVH